MRLLTIAPLVAAAAAGVAGAVVALRRARDAEERLDMLRENNATHYAEVARLKAELKVAQDELRTLRGDGRFHADMSVGEAVSADPRANSVLSAFSIGGCSGCSADDETTLRFAAGSTGKDVDKLVAMLNALDGAGGAQVVENLQRRPNVQLDL